MDYVSRIQEFLDAKGWTVSKLASEAGLTHSTLYKIMNNPNVVPSMATFEAICTAFDISMSDFFDDSYKMSPEGTLLIACYDRLDFRDQEIVTKLVQYMLNNNR